MVYEQLVDRLKDTDFSRLEAIGLPDGSVDSYCRIEKRENEYIKKRKKQ